MSWQVSFYSGIYGFSGTFANILIESEESDDTKATNITVEERAELLTDQDVETLRHLVNEGMDANTLRVLISDLTPLQVWSLAATGRPLLWPAPDALLLKFVAHHLWDTKKR